MASCPAHLVLGSLVLVQLSLQNLLCELHLRFPLILLLLGLVERTMSLGTGIGLLHSILLPEHHRVPELEPLQKAAVCVLHVGQESKQTPSNLLRIWPRTERGLSFTAQKPAWPAEEGATSREATQSVSAQTDLKRMASHSHATGDAAQVSTWHLSGTAWKRGLPSWLGHHPTGQPRTSHIGPIPAAPHLSEVNPALLSLFHNFQFPTKLLLILKKK